MRSCKNQFHDKKYKNSHPQIPLKIITCSTHLFYSKSALIFYWHPKTLLFPQPVDWINGEISIWISRNTHVVWLSKRLIVSCTLYTGWIRHQILLASHAATFREVVFSSYTVSRECKRCKSLQRKSCPIAWGYGQVFGRIQNTEVLYKTNVIV